MDEDPIRLRVTAETCRRLVGAVNDGRDGRTADGFSGRVECERKLSAMADRVDRPIEEPLDEVR